MSKLQKPLSAIVSTKWLAEKLSTKTPNLRVLDGSWHLPVTNRDPKAEFLIKHIPGAQFFGIDECCDHSTKMDHMLPQKSQFSDYVGKLGINNTTHVVVYDNHPDFGLFSAQRVWWTFRIFGHNQVSVLDGGLPKWEREGNKVTDGIDPVEEQFFESKYLSHLVKSFEDVEGNLEKQLFTVVDGRFAGRFHGTHPEPRPDIEPGHIPGSLSVPFMDLLNMEDRTLKSNVKLQEVFQKAGVDFTKSLVGSCGTGISACLLVLAAYQLGHENFAVYDGSWTEWYQRSRPEQRTKTPE